MGPTYLISRRPIAHDDILVGVLISILVVGLEEWIVLSTAEFRKKEATSLTQELKSKVAVIEEQWLEGLGGHLQGYRERVKAYLEENDAWEDLQQVEE